MPCTSNVTVRAGITIYGPPWSTECYRNETEWNRCNPGINILYFYSLIERLGLKVEYTVYPRDQFMLEAIKRGEIDLTATTVSLVGSHRDGLEISPAGSSDNLAILTPMWKKNVQNRFWLFEPLSPVVWMCFFQTVIYSFVITKQAGNYGLRHVMEVYFKSVLRQEHGFEPRGNVDRLSYISFSFLALLVYTFYSSTLIQHLIYQPEITTNSLDRLISLAKSGKMSYLQTGKSWYYKRLLEPEKYQKMRSIPSSAIVHLMERYTTDDIYQKIRDAENMFYIGSYNSKFPFYPLYQKSVRLIKGPNIPGKTYHIFYRRGFPCIQEFNHAILMGLYKDTFASALHNYTAWRYKGETGRYLPKTGYSMKSTLQNRQVTVHDLFFVYAVFGCLIILSTSVLVYEFFVIAWRKLRETDHWFR